MQVLQHQFHATELHHLQASCRTELQVQWSAYKLPTITKALTGKLTQCMHFKMKARHGSPASQRKGAQEIAIPCGDSR